MTDNYAQDRHVHALTGALPWP